MFSPFTLSSSLLFLLLSPLFLSLLHHVQINWHVRINILGSAIITFDHGHQITLIVNNGVELAAMNCCLHTLVSVHNVRPCTWRVLPLRLTNWNLKSACLQAGTRDQLVIFKRAFVIITSSHGLFSAPSSISWELAPRINFNL